MIREGRREDERERIASSGACERGGGESVGEVEGKGQHVYLYSGRGVVAQQELCHLHASLACVR